MKKTLAVLVTTPPNSNLTTTAIDIIEQAINNHIDIVGVFFYQDGVLNAAKNLMIANDEYQSQLAWQTLSQQHHIPLYLCNTAAEKRGLAQDLNDDSNNQQQCTTATDVIHPAFTVAGLGELVQLTSTAQRLIQL